MDNSTFLGYRERVVLSRYTTFGIGGPAHWFAEVRSVAELQHVLRDCVSHDIPFFILGGGSNTLFDDRGFVGVVILNKIMFLEESSDGQACTVHVGAGYSFSLLGTQSARKGWAGLEFASGIPASVGGAIYMNAGAHGVETAIPLVEVTYVHLDGRVEVLAKEALSFGYRTSVFHQERGAIVSARFRLTEEDGARRKQLAIIEYRKRTQPLIAQSAGCMFRNPPGESAGHLIERCGLKGLSIGGAEVSRIHANFLVNTGQATAQDVLQLAILVQETVKAQTGIVLEREVRFASYVPS